MIYRKHHLDLPTEEFTIHEIIACAKTQNLIKTREGDTSLILPSIKASDGKPIIDFSMKIYKEDFSRVSENNIKAVNIPFKVTIIYKSVTCKIILCQVFRKHLTTMAHCADKKKSTSSKYIPNKYMPRMDLGKKTQQIQKDVGFLNEQKKRNEAKIKKLFRSEKVFLSGHIVEKLNVAY